MTDITNQTPARIETEASAAVKRNTTPTLDEKAAEWESKFKEACEWVAKWTRHGLDTVPRLNRPHDIELAAAGLKLARLVRKEAFNQWESAKALAVAERQRRQREGQ